MQPIVNDFDDNYGQVMIGADNSNIGSQRAPQYRNPMPMTSKSNQVLAQSKTVRGESQTNSSGNI